MINRAGEPGGFSDPDIPLKNELRWPYRTWGASVVFSGDDHFYERNKVDDFTYVVYGFGGFPKIPDIRPNEISEGNVIHYRQRHGAMRAEVYEDLMRFQYINIDGEVIDEFYIQGDEDGQLASRAANPGRNNNLPNNPGTATNS